MQMRSFIQRYQSMPWLLVRGMAAFTLLYTQYVEILYLTTEGLLILFATFVLLGGCPTCYFVHLIVALSRQKLTPECADNTCTIQKSSKASRYPQILGILLCTGLFAFVPINPAHASQCSSDIAAIDQAIKNQYEPLTWSNFLLCAVCRGLMLRDNAIVTRAQISEIGKVRQMAVKMNRDGYEMECRESLRQAKRTLMIY
jgi:hypothetical protein